MSGARKWFLYIIMSLGLATSIMLTLLACNASHSPYAVAIVFSAFVALILPTACCFDMQGTDAGDFGWFCTGFFGFGSVGFLIVLWRANEVSDESALFTIGATIAMLLTTSGMAWWFLFRKRKIGYE
jgi:hypothetical protein